MRGRWAAVFDRIIPADDFPAVSEAGLFDHLEQLRADPDSAPVVDRAARVIDGMEAAAQARHGAGVDGLPDAAVDELLEALDWHDREQLVQLAAQAYYGGARRPGARMLGFDRRPSRGPGAPVVEPPVPTVPFRSAVRSHDVLVLGAGAGGGVAAAVLAASGADVLLVDRGAALRFRDIGRDHLRNHRAPVYGDNTSVAPREARELVDQAGATTIEHAHDPRWHDDAMVVGGGTTVFQGMAWRFHPTDFAMATAYGVPEGSSLADWPISYDDLEPHYHWAEHELGVCGDASAHRHQGHRSGPYPMPPLPGNTEARVLGAAAAELGWSTGPVPLLINSEPRDGRARCVQCGECVGFPCPSHAKNGTDTTVIPRALATGRATLLDRSRATELLTDTRGRVVGARLVDERSGEIADVAAEHVVLACGAIETARLLLASRGPSHPQGVGNAHDQVGRHLQGHAFVNVFGLHRDPVIDMDGPGVSIATLDHLHGNDGVVGGGVIANEMIKLPIVHWLWSYPPDGPRWGAAAKAAMRDSYLRTSHLFCQVQEIPRPGTRVSLADRVDGRGVPLVRLHGSAHVETLRAARFVQARAAEWMEASGAHTVWVDEPPTGLTAGHHQAGTCRMGEDPTTSVTAPDGRVHGHENLWVADASVHVTNGGVNPVLTILALAHRTATRLAAGG